MLMVPLIYEPLYGIFEEIEDPTITTEKIDLWRP